MMAPNTKSTYEGILIFPGNQGGTNWYSPSYSPRTGLFYLSAWENTSSVFAKRDQEYVEGQFYGSGQPRSPHPRGIGMGMPRLTQPPNVRMDEENFSAVRALDPRTGERKWEFKMSNATDSGILTTATDLLFSGGREGYFYALDARNGELLWRVNVGGIVAMGPMTYAAEGKQYVAVNAGNSLFVFGLRDD
jgi:alcohol dehydrogenase (cytochrome c)